MGATMNKVMRRVAIVSVSTWITAVGVLGAVEDPAALPTVDVKTIAKLSGLDDWTLGLAALTQEQRQRVKTHLKGFFRRERPKLFTYRAIWAEMVERHENLKASAAENTFDPCEFVADEALEKARSAVEAAKERFEQQCHKASDRIDAFLDEQQYAIVVNARANPNITPCYRWLRLNKADRNQIKRFLQIHEARVKLGRKYPHLKSKISEERLTKQIHEILSRDQLLTLKALEARWKTIAEGASTK